MNKKTREVIQQLISVCEEAARDSINGATRVAARKAIEQGQRLLNPPVRFAWETFKDHNYRALRYRANIGGRWYEITQKKQSDGSFKWSATTWTAEYMADAQFITKNSLTLKEAKQVCVDFGVANYKAKANG